MTSVENDRPGLPEAVRDRSGPFSVCACQRGCALCLPAVELDPTSSRVETAGPALSFDQATGRCGALYLLLAKPGGMRSQNARRFAGTAPQQLAPREIRYRC